MILLAESGSTKTHWRLIKSKEEQTPFKTIGFNPFFIDTKGIMKELQQNLLPDINASSVEKVFFYGAGCSSPERNKVVELALEQLFPDANTIFVEHDLLAAARATCGKEAGIACILGTGSNTCLYDGNDIIDNVPALGYILGDEGSGAHMGKELLRTYLYRELPPDLQRKFEEEYHVDKERIFDAVYHQPLPNRYLASLAPFISEHIKTDVMQRIVRNSFTEFTVRLVKKYEDAERHKVNFVGSIAHTFQDILKKVLEENNLKAGKIIRNPINELVDYHLPEISSK